MDTTPGFISAELKPGELIYCNCPRNVDSEIGTNGLQRVWKLNPKVELVTSMCV